MAPVEVKGERMSERLENRVDRLEHALSELDRCFDELVGQEPECDGQDREAKSTGDVYMKMKINASISRLDGLIDEVHSLIRRCNEVDS